MKKNNMNIVYALYCPVRKIPLYVGQSCNGLERPMKHIKNTSHSKIINNWIRELELKGLSPMIVVLDNNIKKTLLLKRENFWIKHFIEKGFNLLNVRKPNKKHDIFNYKQTNSFSHKLSEWVKVNRKIKNLTQKDLAIYVKCGRNSIWNIECCTPHNTNISVIERIVEFLGGEILIKEQEK